MEVGTWQISVFLKYQNRAAGKHCSDVE